jgi:hypothetical protein
MVGLLILAGVVLFLMFGSAIVNKREDRKAKIEAIYEKKYQEKLEDERKRLEAERLRNERIQYYLLRVCDMVPKDDPEYFDKVRKIAESMADTDNYLDSEMDEEASMDDDTENTTINEKLPF